MDCGEPRLRYSSQQSTHVVDSSHAPASGTCHRQIRPAINIDRILTPEALLLEVDVDMDMDMHIWIGGGLDGLLMPWLRVRCYEV